MQFILTPSEMRKADESAIRNYNISSQVLMENAARSSAEIIVELLEDAIIAESRLCILCGCGNNGGDGFAIARHLLDIFQVSVYWIGSENKMSDETKANYSAIEKLGISITHIEDTKSVNSIDFNYDCIIDALIGVGGTEDVRGIALDILKKLKNNDTLKIAIDIPTGLNSETGFANQNCFKADYTITMFAPKTGLYLNDGIDYAGEIFTAYLGVPDKIIEPISNIFAVESNDVLSILPERQLRTSKFDYGRVLIIAGSSQYPGAAALCANAAITAGAGLVQLCTTTVHPSLLPEVITNVVTSTIEGTISENAYDYIIKSSEKADSIIIGPGLGDADETFNLVRKLIKNISKNKPILIDADALKAIDDTIILRKNIILTPHTGEFARIINMDRLAVEKDSFNVTKSLSSKLNCIILLKHVPSIISDGKKSYFNINGNPGMATGGCGDVLSGIIGSFLAQGIEPLESAALGAFLHAEAGDLYAIENSGLTLTASDLIHNFKRISINYKS
jgi:NAD(P)H-hydrate epimerase